MSSYRHFLCVLLAPTLLGGCSEKPRVVEDEPTQADRERFSGRHVPPPPPPQYPTVTPSTGDPDHDFLRSMSDHHAGLMVVIHAAIESNRSPSLQLAIRKIEDDYDRKLDVMSGMLRRIYADRYVPIAAGDYSRTAQTLRAGTRDSTTFFRTALKNEEQALQMINVYLPKAKNARVKRYAKQLSRDEPRESAALRKILNEP